MFNGHKCGDEIAAALDWMPRLTLFDITLVATLVLSVTALSLERWAYVELPFRREEYWIGLFTMTVLGCVLQP